VALAGPHFVAGVSQRLRSSRTASMAGRSSSAIWPWLWPSLVRRPASVMMIWKTLASAIPRSFDRMPRWSIHSGLPLRLASQDSSPSLRPHERSPRTCRSARCALERILMSRASLGCRRSVDGQRGRRPLAASAKVQEDLVSHALGKIGSPELPKRIPSVAEQLREMGRVSLDCGPFR
jgi:hypothetical protein